MSKTEQAISQMEAWANDNSHGYDQIYRWGQYGDYDCSSSVIQAWENAGVPVKTMGATYTGNMYSIFTKCGFKDVTGYVNLATGSGLIRGDVLLNHVNHVAMYCGNGYEVEASINEFGGATGGQPGDQTGYEFLIRPYRNYPWNVVLRYEDSEPETERFSFTTKTIKQGDKGIHVWRLRMILKARGYYKWSAWKNPATCPFTIGLTNSLKKWQKKAGLAQTGICTEKLEWATLLGLEKINGRWYVDECSIGMTANKSVYLFQEFLKASGYYTGKLDWNFGTQMEAAVIKYQKAAKLPQTGEIDYETARHIIGDA